MLTDLFVIFLLRLDYLWSLYLLPWGLSFPIHQSQSDMELAAFAVSSCHFYSIQSCQKAQKAKDKN
jgi:hypothetical protein